MSTVFEKKWLSFICRFRRSITCQKKYSYEITHTQVDLFLSKTVLETGQLYEYLILDILKRYTPS